MADWSKPTIISNYVTFVDEVKNRDIDAITLQLNVLTNPPVGSIKLVRGATVKFQEWDGTQFVDKILGIAGGGTGSSTPAGAASALGLGTMAFQNANAIAVTGGSIANMNSSGQFTHTGMIYSTGTTQSAVFAAGVSGQYAVTIVGGPTAGGHGIFLTAGADRMDVPLNIVNRAQNRAGLVINGAMEAQFSWRLIIPVGTDYWTPA